MARVIDEPLACWLIPLGEQPRHRLHKVRDAHRAGQDAAAGGDPGAIREARRVAPFSDGMLVRRVARDFVKRHGQDAPRFLGEYAEISQGQGDAESAQTWRDIADAAEKLL